MKANELRIGNWITKKNPMYTSEQVKVINGQWINNSPEDNFSGISLNEEWLLKFGFEIENKSSYSFGYEKKYNVYRKALFTYNGIQAAWWYNNKVLLIQPEYVHQLQNLYFALTGKELTV